MAECKCQAISQPSARGPSVRIYRASGDVTKKNAVALVKLGVFKSGHCVCTPKGRGKQKKKKKNKKKTKTKLHRKIDKVIAKRSWVVQGRNWPAAESGYAESGSEPESSSTGSGITTLFKYVTCEMIPLSVKQRLWENFGAYVCIFSYESMKHECTRRWGPLSLRGYTTEWLGSASGRG